MSYITNSLRIRGKDGRFLSQDEAVTLVKKRAHKQGFSYRSKKNPDGSVNLVLTKKEGENE